MEPETQPESQALAEAAARAVAPDPLTAQLLAKHSAGVRLSPSEYGKLGVWAKVKNRLLGKGSPAPQSAQSGPEPGNPAGMGALAQIETQNSGLAPVPVDPLLIKRTTAALLKSGETLARRKVERAARQAGADGATVARFGNAAAMPQVTTQLTIDVAPDATKVVAEMLGIEDLRLYPVAAAVAALGIYATNLWLLVDELRSLAEKRPAPASPPEAPAVIQPAAQPAVLPDPAQPKGAPPTLT